MIFLTCLYYTVLNLSTENLKPETIESVKFGCDFEKAKEITLSSPYWWKIVEKNTILNQALSIFLCKNESKMFNIIKV